MSSYRRFRRRQRKATGVRVRDVRPLLNRSVIRRLVAQLAPAR